MRRRMLTVLTLALMVVALMAGPAAARPSKPDTACLQAGLSVLQEAGGVAQFARDGVPLSLIGGEGTLPLNEVLRLHLSSPELFPWCD